MLRASLTGLLVLCGAAAAQPEPPPRRRMPPPPERIVRESVEDASAPSEEGRSQTRDQIRYAKQLIEQGGGRVAACIIDPEGSHMGYRRTPSYHRQAVDLFLGNRGE